MKQSKEEIISEMLAEGLLSEDDAKRYLADKSVSADEMEEIKRLIQLCRDSRKSGKYTPAKEVHKMIRKKYFSEKSDESTPDDTLYRKQLLMLIERSEQDIKEGRCRPIDDFFNSFKKENENRNNNNRKEQIIADMLANGLLSDEYAERYRTDKSVSADEMKYIGQLILLCKLVNADEIEEIRQIIELCRESRKANKYIPADEVHKKLWSKYFSNSECSTDDETYTKQLILLCEKSENEIANGQEYSIDEVFDRIKKKYANNGYEQKTSGVSKAQTLKLLLDRGDISQDEYDKYMADENFTDYSAEELKDDYDAIRDCEDDIKNGRLYSEEEAIKRIKED